MDRPDRIRVTGIRIQATHGVYEHEKRNAQPFLIDLDCRLRRRPDVDELGTTVDYAELIQRVAAVATAGSVDLIETLAERIAASCLSDQRIAEVEVTVHKPEAPLPVPTADIAVTIVRPSR